MATETPSFTIQFREGGYEVRDYPDILCAEVSVSGERDDATTRGFRLLFGYIAGDNRRIFPKIAAPTAVAPRAQSQTIAMTSPVFQTETARGWVMRIAMPRDFALNTLPLPTSPLVTLAVVPAARYAVVRFSGRAGIEDFEHWRGELFNFARKHHLAVAGPIIIARYNPPWTPWFLRRNEVLAPVLPAD